MKSKQIKYFIGLGIFALFLVGIWACSSDNGGSGTNSGGSTPGQSGGNSGSGTLNINLTDSPFTEAQAVLVTFSEVQAHNSGNGWVTVPFSGSATSRTCDLKKLVGAQDVLGTGPLPSGHYTQIRLVVTQGALYFNNPSTGSACAASMATPSGESAPLEISSGEIKLNREFDLAAGGTGTILLDFDGDQSIHQTGNGRYRMNPVISIVSVQ